MEVYIMTLFDQMILTRQKILKDTQTLLWNQYIEYFKSIVNELEHTPNIAKIKINFSLNQHDDVFMALFSFYDKFGERYKPDGHNLYEVNLEKEFYTFLPNLIEDMPLLDYKDEIILTSDGVHARFKHYSNINYAPAELSPSY